MKVLLVEDAGSIYTTFNGHAEKLNIEFVKAFQISDARDKFNDEIEFIILDINVVPTGLKKDEVDKTEANKLSGWIWLENYVLKNKSEWRKKVIIYSEYIDLLKTKIQPERLKGIKLMEKGKYLITDVIDEMLQMVESLKKTK